MNKPTLGVAAMLMLSAAPFAYAQDGRDRMPGPSLERGAGPDMPSGGGSDMPGGGGGDGPRGGASVAGSRDEGPGSAGAPDEAPARSSEGPNPAVRDDAPRREPSGAERKEGSTAKEKRVDQGDMPSRKSADDTTGADRKTKKGADKAEKSPDKAESESKSKRGALAKSEEDRGERSKGKDAAETDKAKPAEADKQAAAKDAETDRKSVDEVKKADLSGEKRSRVGTEFRKDRDVKRRTDVDINISVGSRLPRDWGYAPVPVAVVEVVPEYRGYVFAYVEDDYVILDPVTYEVVTILPAGDSGPAYAGGGGGAVADRCSTRLTLTEEERADIVRSIQMTDEVDVSNITVGWSVPGEIELRRFPVPVVSHTSKLESCRYFIADDQIAIVDPAEETVVLLIDHNE